MQINLAVPNDVLRSFAWTAYTCKFLFENAIRSQGVSATLKDWNNDHGVEFDMLQSVFPSQIPRTQEFNSQPHQACTGKFHSLSSLTLFVATAIQVDASFDIEDGHGESLSVHDTCIQIETLNRAFIESSGRSGYWEG
jgi:hypothetical protein